MRLTTRQLKQIIREAVEQEPKHKRVPTDNEYRYGEHAEEDEYHYADGVKKVVKPDGEIIWYKNGKKHRDDDEPAVVYPNGTKFWYKNGDLNRDGDQPAAIFPNGAKFWYKNDKQHRDGDEPAEISHDQGGWAKRWWKNGKFIRQEYVQQLKK